MKSKMLSQFQELFHRLLSYRITKATTNFFLQILSTVALCLIVLPPLIYGKDGMLKPDSYHFGIQSKLEIALQSVDYKQSLYTSAIITLPMLVDFILDWFHSMHPSRNVLVSMGSLLISIIVPDFILLFFVCPYNAYQYFPTLWAISQYFIMAGIITLLAEYGRDIINAFPAIFAVSAYIAYLVLSTYEQFGNHQFTAQIHYVRTVSIFLAVISLTIVCFLWFSNLRKLAPRDISRNDMISSALLVVVSLISVATLWLVIKNGPLPMMDRDVQYVTTYSYLCTAYAVVGITMTGRVFRYDMSRLHERQSRELDQKRSFVRYISHEIRTPLNTVLMGLQLLKREVRKLPPSSVEQVGEIVDDLQTSCDTAVEILNEILEYEKLQVGILNLELKEVGVVAFMNDCVASFQVYAFEKNIALRMEYDSNMEGRGSVRGARVDFKRVVLTADPWKLSQVIRNLLSNAIKFTQPGGRIGVHVMIVAEEQDAQRNKGNRLRLNRFNSSVIHSEKETKTKLVITVTDSGAGISKENQSRLFKEIVQFEPGRLQEGKGSGLGLWISKGIVDLHKGKISVFSDGEGNGSKFILELPLERRKYNPLDSRSPSEVSGYIPPNRPSPTISRNNNASAHVSEFIARQDVDPNPEADALLTCERQRAESPLVPTAELNRNVHLVDIMEQVADLIVEEMEKRALIVDDAPMNRKMLQRLLEAKFQSIDIAEDGAIAVEKTRSALSNERPYHTIFMDYQMPNMDGPTAAQTIREMGFTGPIIGVTGNALAADVEWFISHGANVVLPKPVEFKTLLKAISDSD